MGSVGGWVRVLDVIRVYKRRTFLHGGHIAKLSKENRLQIGDILYFNAVFFLWWGWKFARSLFGLKFWTHPRSKREPINPFFLGMPFSRLIFLRHSAMHIISYLNESCAWVCWRIESPLEFYTLLIDTLFERGPFAVF